MSTAEDPTNSSHPAESGRPTELDRPAAPAEFDRPDTRAVPRPTTPIARIVSLPIVAYRRWISPGLPPVCRFYPSCSEYALTAIATHGAFRGLGLAIWRLLRCHPFHPGGIDPVPPPRTRAATTRLEL